MKKMIAIGLFTLLIMTGCNNETGKQINSELVDIGDLGTGYDLFRDMNTGCVYIRENSAHAYPLTAYYGEDGKVVGCGEKDLDKSKYN